MNNKIYDSITTLRNEVNCRIEHGAESNGHLDYVQKELNKIVRHIATDQPVKEEKITYTEKECEAIRASIKHWTEDINQLNWKKCEYAVGRENHFLVYFGAYECSCCAIFRLRSGNCYRCPLKCCSDGSTYSRAKMAFKNNDQPAFENARREILDTLINALKDDKKEEPDEIFLPVGNRETFGLSVFTKSSSTTPATQGAAIEHDGIDYLIVSFRFKETEIEYPNPIVFRSKSEPDEMWENRMDDYTIPVYAYEARCVRVTERKW